MPVPELASQRLNLILSEMPKLHIWNGEHNHGGFDGPMLASIFYSVFPDLPDNPTVIETGAGLSTLAFLAISPKNLFTVSVDPEGGLEGRIRDWATSHSFPIDQLTYYNSFSELVLPTIAGSGVIADVCMMDGGHGWPTVFVDFCYLNMCLRNGGFLVVDDLHLYSVMQLCLLLKRQPGWKIHHKIGQKTVIFQKLTDDRFLPDFGGQSHVIENSFFL